MGVMLDFDLIIIGSGSGNSIPNESMDGWNIAIVEGGTFGGTCLNVGCIPSKMLIYPADVIGRAAAAQKLGVAFDPPVVDWPSIRDRTFGRIDTISESGKNWRANLPNVTAFFGYARMTGDCTFDIDGQTIRGERVVLAAGARPHLPDIDGLAECGFHTSDSIMRIDTLPQHLVVLGAGFIANEMAHVFASYGSKVTVIARGTTILRGHDDDVSQRFLEANRHRIDFRLGCAPVSARPGNTDGSGCVITLESGDEVAGDALLVATGRIPNSDLLEVACGGVEVDADGYVIVDKHLRTSAPGVWALGDLRNPHQLKHLANRDARVVQHNLLHPDSLISIDERAVPHAVFAQPQIAACGATEQELVAAGTPFVVGRRDFGGTAAGWSMEDEVGFAKVLVDPVARTLLGAHIIGYQAAILIQPLVQGMQCGLTIDQMARDTIYPHPALSEVIENAMLEAIGALDA